MLGTRRTLESGDFDESTNNLMISTVDLELSASLIPACFRPFLSRFQTTQKKKKTLFTGSRQPTKTSSQPQYLALPYYLGFSTIVPSSSDGFNQVGAAKGNQEPWSTPQSVMNKLFGVDTHRMSPSTTSPFPQACPQRPGQDKSKTFPRTRSNQSQATPELGHVSVWNRRHFSFRA